MRKKIILVGANNPETLRIIEAMNASGAYHEIIGWLDNDTNKYGTDVFGYEVLGAPELLLEKKYRECFVFNNITRNGLVREAVTEQLKQYTNQFANVIHPSVNLAGVIVGQGVCIQEGALVQSHAVLGDHCFLTSTTLIGHEAVIGENVFIAGGCVIAGMSIIGAGATIWTGAKIAPRLKIGNRSVIGINSSVLTNISDNVTVFGNPAREIFRKPDG
ncbi:MAG: hypothetical protein WCP01_04620 [Methylococcaceae bacterium]